MNPNTQKHRIIAVERLPGRGWERSSYDLTLSCGHVVREHYKRWAGPITGALQRCWKCKLGEPVDETGVEAA